MTTTTLCRCWRLTRTDGKTFAFTDHDTALSFDDTEFHPTEALTARALEQSTGLSVDNTEAMGALSDAGLTEEDILAGRFDGAEVEIFEVDWSSPGIFRLLFTGELGEIERAGGAFKAELRGLTERLNVPHGQLYQRLCRAALGDMDCRVNIGAQAYAFDTTVIAVDGPALTVPALGAPDGWFEHGTFSVMDRSADGLIRRIRGDTLMLDQRRIVLTEAVGAGLAPGDPVRLIAGCDKRDATCAGKFDNIVNFRGCPHLPSEDWLFAYPRSSA